MVFNRLSTPGSAQRSCQTCFGQGTYWDLPSAIFRAFISFMDRSPTPMEPGSFMNENLGPVQQAGPSITIPYQNLKLAQTDPGQPTKVWNEASTDDMFIAVDMLARFTAVLQVGGITNLPYQQNLQIAPTGAVTIWNPATNLVEPVPNYGISGPTVTIDGYDTGTNYMVEFQAAPIYVAWRRAGSLPHVRPFGGGTVSEPRRFHIQSLDLWTRQRGIQPTAAGSTVLGGSAGPFVVPVMAPLG